MNSVEHPPVRERVLWRLEGFADPEYQRKEWRGNPVWRPGDKDSFDDAINDFFDLIGDDDDPTDSIGTVLLNEAEADAIRPVIKLVELVIERQGSDCNLEDCEADPAWPRVIAAAQAALPAFEEHQTTDGTV